MATATIRDDEHVYIAGMTGSGKTFLMKTYLRGVGKQIFILDTKGTFEWNDIPKNELVTINHLKDIEDAAANFRRVIYRPTYDELKPDYYNSFFEFCYYLRNCCVGVDEAMQICPTPSRIPEFYKGILTRGRELNVTVWSATQRPATIPVVIYSEATHWFVFKLTSANDRKRMAEFTGYDEFLQSIPKQEFFYFNANTSNPPVLGKLKV